jgi:uncharacterized small protein (DUF1192 family)
MKPDDDDKPLAKSATRHEIGEMLDRLSVEELQARITLLHNEILRLEAAIGAKTASRQAADAFFKR